MLSYEAKKRIKLTVCLFGIPIIIVLISFFLHDLFLIPFVANETKLLSEWYRDTVHEEIKKEERTDGERKLLWDLSGKNSIKELNTSVLLELIRIFYILVGILVAIPTAILTKWYTVDSRNLIISTEEEKKIKGKVLDNK